MDTEATQHTSSGILFVLGGIGFVLVLLLALVLVGLLDGGMGGSAEGLAETLETLTVLSGSGQAMAMLFWFELSLLAGFLWERAIFRMSAWRESLISALALSGLVITLSVFLPRLFLDPSLAGQDLSLVYAAIALFAFMLLGILLLIGREVLVVLFHL